jgi:hypothetical protein
VRLKLTSEESERERQQIRRNFMSDWLEDLKAKKEIKDAEAQKMRSESSVIQAHIRPLFDDLKTALEQRVSEVNQTLFGERKPFELKQDSDPAKQNEFHIDVARSSLVLFVKLDMPNRIITCRPLQKLGPSATSEAGQGRFLKIHLKDNKVILMLDDKAEVNVEEASKQVMKPFVSQALGLK